MICDPERVIDAVCSRWLNNLVLIVYPMLLMYNPISVCIIQRTFTAKKSTYVPQYCQMVSINQMRLMDTGKIEHKCCFAVINILVTNSNND